MPKFDIRDISQKWFSETIPQNHNDATADIGSGTNGKVTISATGKATTTDKVSVVKATGANAALSAEYNSGKITVTLGTGSTAGTVDDTKNTALLIAAAINTLDGFTAKASGTGATAISTVTSSDVAFSGGKVGTVCPIKNVGFENGGTYYLCTKESMCESVVEWKTFTLSDLV